MSNSKSSAAAAFGSATSQGPLIHRGNQPVGVGVSVKPKLTPIQSAQAAESGGDAALAARLAELEARFKEAVASKDAELEALKQQVLLAKAKPGKAKQQKPLQAGVSKSGTVFLQGGPIARGMAYYVHEWEGIFALTENAQAWDAFKSMIRDPNLKADQRVQYATEREQQGLNWGDVKDTERAKSMPTSESVALPWST